MISQAKELDFFENIDLITSLGGDVDTLSSVGGDIPDGIWNGTWYWFQHPDTEKNRNFVANIDERFGRLPTMWDPTAYEAVYLYKKAIESAGSTEPNEVIAQLEGMEHEGPRGQYKLLAESHQATSPAITGDTSESEEYDFKVLDPIIESRPSPDTIRSALNGTDIPPGI
jgi:branched-chain amino acid transport system substrate-binding protein